MNREYPARPIVGVLAMVQRGERFLLVRRGRQPNLGFWGFPGGVQELGETVIEAALRELGEETGVAAADPRVLTAVDAIEHDAEGRVRYHYSLIAVHLAWRAGEGEPADDADALGWFRLEEIEAIPVLHAVGGLMLLASRAGATG